MDKKIEGSFSLGLCSLQFQLQHLLEGSGGEAAGTLLDLLAELNEDERAKLLNHFIEVARGLVASNKATENLSDSSFESDLFKDIMSVIESKKERAVGESPRLAVVAGRRGNARSGTPSHDPTRSLPALQALDGGAKRSSRLIDFQDALSRRR